MDRKYHQTFQDYKQHDNSKIALTTDVWTSVGTEAYLDIICRFTKRYLGHGVHLSDPHARHTASDIDGCLDTVAARFQIHPS